MRKQDANVFLRIPRAQKERWLAGAEALGQTLTRFVSIAVERRINMTTDYMNKGKAKE